LSFGTATSPALRTSCTWRSRRYRTRSELDAAFCLLAGEVPDWLTVDLLSHDEMVATFAPDRAPPAPHVSGLLAGDHGSGRGCTVPSAAFS
jgi:hypothetical protein